MKKTDLVAYLRYSILRFSKQQTALELQFLQKAIKLCLDWELKFQMNIW